VFPATITPGSSLAVSLDWNTVTGAPIATGSYTTQLDINHDAPVSGTHILVDVSFVVNVEVYIASGISTYTTSNLSGLTSTSFTLRHSASGSVAVTLTKSTASWLTISPTSFTFNGVADQLVTLTCSTSGLTSQDYTATVTYSYTITSNTVSQIVSLTFSVYSVPVVPVLLPAVTTTTSLTQGWSSGGDGTPSPGQPITGYEFSWKLTSDSTYTIQSTSMALETTLSASQLTSYTVRVRAQNVIGWSAYASAVVITQGSVCAPISSTVSFANIFSDSVDVLFSDGNNAKTGTVAPTSYSVAVSPLGSAFAVIATSSSDYSLTVSGLTAGVSYTFSVTIVNAVGSSTAVTGSLRTPTCTSTSTTVCSGHGTCSRVNTVESCSCSGIYFGSICQSSCPTSSSSVCSGHGSCDTFGVCACSSGYVSSDCSLQCTCPDPLQVCSYTTTKVCTCPTGYVPNSANTACFACPGGTSNPCSGVGICSFGTSSAVCECPSTHAGASCQVACTNGCSNHGVCQSDGICACDEGFIGNDCSMPCPVSNSLICNDHGTCSEISSTAVCTCEALWGESDCGVQCPGTTGSTPCSDHGTCNATSSGVSCECRLGWSGEDCYVNDNAIGATDGVVISAAASLAIFIVWGAEDVDMSTYNPLDGESHPTVLWDSSFVPSDSEAQIFLRDFCVYMKSEDIINLVRPEMTDCFFDLFATWAEDNTYGFPVDQGTFDLAMSQFLEGDGSDHTSRTGFVSNSMSWFQMKVTTYTRAAQSGQGLFPTYEYWESWMKDINSQAPASCNKAFQTANEYPTMIVELAFIEGTILEIQVAVSSAFGAVVLFTGNIFLALMGIFMVLFVVTALLAFMVLMNWTMGAVEAVCLSIIVGMSVDYALHIGHALVHSDYFDRVGRARDSITMVGMSVLGGATTTVGSMVVLMFCTIHTFVVMGLIMIMTIVWSVLASMGTMLCASSMIGPQGHQGDIVYFFRYVLCCREKPKVNWKHSHQEDVTQAILNRHGTMKNLNIAAIPENEGFQKIVGHTRTLSRGFVASPNSGHTRTLSSGSVASPNSVKINTNQKPNSGPQLKQPPRSSRPSVAAKEANKPPAVLTRPAVAEKQSSRPSVTQKVKLPTAKKAGPPIKLQSQPSFSFIAADEIDLVEQNAGEDDAHYDPYKGL